ncbi:restriction endonuclease subunit S [Cognatiluteimonas profundi]|uniref:restriction endonuclease subunit S n=1 Tax=Cognatiluteimonas profundi TaxID=2594501 RepID=UPI0018EEEEF0|nr:restriction endonuclease subunit S [Lysobacter profundi]
MNFPYSKYRACENKWIGGIPAHWDVASLKWVSKRYSGGTPDKTRHDYWEDGTIPWLNSGAVNDQRIVAPSAYITEEAFQNSSAKWISPGALVMALAGQGKTKGMVARVMFETTCNQSMAAIVPDQKCDARFLFWWLTSNYQNIRNMAGGDLRDGLNLELLGSIPCPLPTTDEQAAIATFLGRETAKIDALIAEQEKLLVLLAEKRQATISHAVTRGLDPEATMKDSGIKWLGKVPAHWRVTRLKYAVELMVDCPHETPVYDSDGAYKVIRTADVSEGVLDVRSIYSVNESEYRNRIRRQELVVGDIVYGREGERWGFAAMIPLSETFCLGQRMMQFRASSLMCPAYLMWQLNSLSTYRQGQMDTVGATSPHVNVGTIQNYALAEPPIGEQRAISAHIEAEAAKSDALRLEVGEVINLLKERRGALIAAAVTGKIDVRGAASERQAA